MKRTDEANGLNFEQVYLTYHNQIQYRIMHALRCNIQLAEELADNVFIKVSKHLANFDSEKSCLNTWLNTIANRVMIDYMRSKQGQMTRKSSNIQDYVDEEGKEFFQIETSKNELTDANLALSELQILVNRTLNGLSEIQRKVCELQIDGLEMAEISQELSIPEGTVKVYIHRFRKILKPQIALMYSAN